MNAQFNNVDRSARRLVIAASWALAGIGGIAFAAEPPAVSRSGVIDWSEVAPLESASASVADDLGITPAERPDLALPAPAAEPAEAAAPPASLFDRERATGNWGGLRTRLENLGLTIAPTLTIDYGANLRGGASASGSAFRHLFNVGLTLDASKAFGIEGGTFFVNFQEQQGQSGSDEVGDFQGVGNADADGRTQISDLWYEQVLANGALRMKVGKIDANTEFAVSKYASEFVNSSFGVSPAILGLPTYPDPAAGFAIFLKPCERLSAGFGIFDGSGQEGIATGSRGPATLFGPPADLFMVGELGVNWDLAGGRSGRAAGGVWHHTGSFDRFGGGADSGATGGYLIVDQLLWRENPTEKDDGQGIAVFAVYGYANPAISEIAHHVAGGIAWTGPLAGRDSDVLGLAATWVRFTDAPAAGFENEGETAIELFYKLQLTPWFAVKPDLQYVHNPGGQADQADALAAAVRLTMSF